MSNPQRSEAHRLINRSIERGKIKRPDKCEICGAKQRVWHSFSNDEVIIVAHHWRGYDHPLDVWWVCISCNALLRGIHDGSLAKDKFAEIIKLGEGSGRQRDALPDGPGYDCHSQFHQLRPAGVCRKLDAARRGVRGELWAYIIFNRSKKL